MDSCDQKFFKLFRSIGDCLLVFFFYLAEDLLFCPFVPSETKKEYLVKKSPAFQLLVPGHPFVNIIAQEQHRLFIPVKDLAVDDTF